MAEREPPAGTGGFLVLVLEAVSVDPHRGVAALRQFSRRPSAGTGARCGMAGAIDPNGYPRLTLGTAGRNGVFPHGVGVSLPRRAYGQSSRPDLEVRVFDRSVRRDHGPELGERVFSDLGGSKTVRVSQHPSIRDSCPRAHHVDVDSVGRLAFRYRIHDRIWPEFDRVVAHGEFHGFVGVTGMRAQRPEDAQARHPAVLRGVPVPQRRGRQRFGERSAPSRVGPRRARSTDRTGPAGLISTTGQTCSSFHSPPLTCHSGGDAGVSPASVFPPCWARGHTVAFRFPTVDYVGRHQ